MIGKHAELEKAAGPVSRETFEALLHYEAAFLKWNERINLASASTTGGFWARHVVDSAQLIRHIASTGSIVDFGSGGGFPGGVLAVLLRNSSSTVHLIESNRKKAAFLTTVLAELDAPAVIHAQRVETVVSALPAPSIVTARAFSALGRILDLAGAWWDKGTRGLLHKGRDYAREVAEARDEWSFDLLEHPSVTERGSVILDLTHVRRKRTSAG